MLSWVVSCSKTVYLYVSECVVCKDEGVSSPIVNTSMAIIIITFICWCDELISGHIDYLVNVGCGIHDNKVAACILTEYRVELAPHMFVGIVA